MEEEYDSIRVVEEDYQTKPSQDRIVILLYLQKKPLPYTEIAQKVNLSEQRVYHILPKYPQYFKAELKGETDKKLWTLTEKGTGRAEAYISEIKRRKLEEKQRKQAAEQGLKYSPGALTYLPYIEDILTQDTKERVVKPTHENPRVYTVDLNELSKIDIGLTEDAIEKPETLKNAFTNAIYTHFKQEIDALDINEMYIRFAGFADLYVALSDFRKENLDRLVVTKGNIASRDDPKLCLAVAVYSCPHCGRSYRIPIAHGKRVPKSHPCECERKAELVPEDCVRDDTAFLALTEPVITTSSEEPVTRTVQLIGSDLVHKSRFPQLQPGIDVKLTGVLKAYKPPKQSMEDYILLVESVEPLQTEFEYITFTEEEREKILKLGNEKGIIKKLRDSIAPHIHGYEEIKDAVLLQFFEGTKPKLSRPGRATRNSIHILLIGDPGTAKTDMCNSAATLHPKAVMVHGPGATGKGITAVVEKSEAGTFRVKAGALVRANNGLCVIEEFGNLPKEDRVHLKTVMENENYILEKAGQRRTFKTHCSILANANPKTGAYDPYAKSIPEQFDIDRALQDRFDLIFPITDISEKEKDALVSQVMLRKHTENISGNVKGTKPPIAPDLFKKYVAYARRNVNPVLTKEAEEEITRQFVEFRNVYRNQIAVTKSEITARAQNTIVRLAEARAKAELRDEVSPEDVKEAGRIIHYALRETYKANENATELDFGKHYELSGTEIDRMRTLENLIRQEVNKKKEVTEDYVISMAMNEHELESLPPHEIEKYLTELQKKGIIFKPKAGIIKLVTER